MKFPQVTNRLQAIKKEIHELRLIPIVDIQEKIQNLKSINLLLREQNQLLLIRQQILNAKKNNGDSTLDSYPFLSLDYESEWVA